MIFMSSNEAAKTKGTKMFNIFEIELADETLENIASDVAAFGCCDDDFVATRETLDQYKESRANYAEKGDMREGVTSQGYPYVLIRKAQLKAGQPRKSVLVVDLGAARAALVM